MKINKLNLISFGKFENKEIELEDGINLFYGENEAGKTTIHDFIEGIFYGFLIPYAKLTKYKEEYYRYRPLYQESYRGSLELDFRGETYLIERNFLKGQENLKVYLKASGEDITNNLDLGAVARVGQPGYEFFGFNDRVYANTISIGQLESKTDEDLANELRDRLSNLTSTRDEDISIEKAVGSLDVKLKEIGSERAPKSPYGSLIRNIDRLKEEVIKLGAKESDYKKLLLEEENFKKRNKESLDFIENLEKDYEKSLSIEIKKELDKLEELDQDILSIERDLVDLSPYEDLDRSDYNRLIDLDRDLNNISSRLADLEEELGSFDIARLECGQEEPVLMDKYLRIEELEEEKQNLKFHDRETGLDLLKKDLEKEARELGRLSKLSIFSLLMSLVFLLSRIIVGNNFLLLGMVLFLFISFYCLRSKGVKKTLLDQRELGFKRELDLSHARSTRIIEIDSEIRGILEETGFTNKFDLKKEANRMEVLNMEGSLNLARKKDRKRTYDLKLSKLKALEESGQALKAEKSKIFAEHEGINSLLDYEEALEKKRKYEEKVKELDLKTLMREEKTQFIESMDGKDLTKTSYTDLGGEVEKPHILREQIEIKKQELAQEQIEFSVLGERIRQAEKDIKKLQSLREELIYLEAELDLMKQEKLSIDLAKETILALSKEIHRDFAPLINKSLGESMERISAGKYKELMVDSKLDIKVKDPRSGELLDISKLSAGTMDQIYFALRLAIIDETGAPGLPLILDDCFIQYDDSRLERIMEILGEEARKRQIIMFSCQKREIETFDRLKIPYRLVDLNQKI